MVQTYKHGIGKEDHTNTTIKGLPDRMPDVICQRKFGFDNIELLQKYDALPKIQQEQLLKDAFNEINTYFLTSNKDYKIDLILNHVRITYSNIPKSEREDFGMVILEIIDQIKNRILNFEFFQDYYITGMMRIRFQIRNCGFIPEEENVMTKNQSVITSQDKMSSQNGSEKEEMSSQNQNVITKEKKEKFIHLRISESNKTKIQEKAKKSGYTSVSKYIIDVMTDRKSVITPQENTIKDVMTDEKVQDIKLCCQQLLGLFDEIFEIKYPKRIITKLLKLLNGIDSELIDTVKGYLNE